MACSLVFENKMINDSILETKKIVKNCHWLKPPLWFPVTEMQYAADTSNVKINM